MDMVLFEMNVEEEVTLLQYLRVTSFGCDIQK